MKGISAIPAELRGKVVFIVGNGQSKRFYNIQTLGRYGLIFAANQAFKEHWVDLLGYRDDDMLPLCSPWPGNKVTWIQAPERDGGKYVQAAKNIYGFDYLDDKLPRLHGGDLNPNSPNHPDWGKGDFVKKGSTGFIMAQIAVRIGCMVLILVGCDCAFLRGYESSKTTEDDSTHLRGTVLDRYQGFAEQFTGLAKYAESKGILVYKLGQFGNVEVPVIEAHELLGFEPIRNF